MRNHIALVVALCAVPGAYLAISNVLAGESRPTRDDRDWPARAISERRMPGMLRNDIEEARRAETAYRSVLDSNREQAGSVADGEVDRLRHLYTERLLSVTSRQVTLLQAEVESLRKEVQTLKTVRVVPVASNGLLSGER